MKKVIVVFEDGQKVQAMVDSELDVERVTGALHIQSVSGRQLVANWDYINHYLVLEPEDEGEPADAG